MLLAELRLVLSIVFTIAILGGLVAAIVFLFLGYEGFAKRSLQRRYVGLQVHDVPQPGDVVLTYHTYHGLLVWFTQTPHHVAMPPADARLLLGRLLRFNLVWGLFTYGALFVPPLAILNYFVQRRSIAAQESANALRSQFDPPPAVLSHFAQQQSKATQEPANANALSVPADQIAQVPAQFQDSEDDPDVLPETRTIRKASPRSLFRQVIGWICVGICVLSSIYAVAGLVTANFELALGGVILAVPLGLVARDWLRSR